MDEIKILLIDDNPDDRDLVIRELIRSFPNAHIIQIINYSELEKELNQLNYDIVITDYQLKWSNGIEILKKIKELNPLLPVIMFTGTGNEEVAVESMKLGLDDYVIKSPKHFKRLPFSVKSVLDNVKHKIREKLAEEKYKKIFESVPVGIINLYNWIIHEINPYALEILGLKSEDKQKEIHFKYFFLNQEEFDKLSSILIEENEVRSFETQLKSLDGKEIWTKIDAKLIEGKNHIKSIQITLKDITLEKLLEAQLIQSQKLEAIGLLVSGITHDFNNILTPIMGYSDMLLLNPNIDETTKTYLKYISNLTESASNIIIQLLIFSKTKIYLPELINPNQVILEMTKILQRYIGEDIKIITELDPSINIIKIDKN